MNYTELATALYMAVCDADDSEHAGIKISNIALSLREIDTSGEHIDLFECLEKIGGAI